MKSGSEVWGIDYCNAVDGGTKKLLVCSPPSPPPTLRGGEAASFPSASSLHDAAATDVATVATVVVGGNRNRGWAGGASWGPADRCCVKNTDGGGLVKHATNTKEVGRGRGRGVDKTMLICAGTGLVVAWCRTPMYVFRNFIVSSAVVVKETAQRSATPVAKIVFGSYGAGRWCFSKRPPSTGSRLVLFFFVRRSPSERQPSPPMLLLLLLLFLLLPSLFFFSAS